MNRHKTSRWHRLGLGVVLATMGGAPLSVESAPPLAAGLTDDGLTSEDRLETYRQLQGPADETSAVRDILIVDTTRRNAIFGMYQLSRMTEPGWDLFARTIDWAISYRDRATTRIWHATYNGTLDPDYIQERIGIAAQDYLVNDMGFDPDNIRVAHQESIESGDFTGYDLVLYTYIYPRDATNVMDQQVPFVTICVTQADEMGIGTGQARMHESRRYVFVVDNDHDITSSYSLGPLTLEEQMYMDATTASDNGRVLLNADGFSFRVPQDWPTIQAAILVARDGDVVLVDDGVYSGPGNQNVDFLGKLITVRSENGPENCIIDCGEVGRGFYFHRNETSAAVVEGFTVRRGLAESGAGILCDSSSPTIRNCTFRANTAIGVPTQYTGIGGGIACIGGAGPAIEGCTFEQNAALGGSAQWTGLGGAVACTDQSSPVISSCTFESNSAEAGSERFGGLGGAVFVSDESHPRILDCTFVQNSVSGSVAETGRGGAVFIHENCEPRIAGSTFEGNVAQGPSRASSRGGAIYVFDAKLVVEDSVFQENSASARGGGLFAGRSELAVSGSTFLGNTADQQGGGMEIEFDSTATVTNCTFRRNNATSGGGIHTLAFGNTDVVGCVFEGNRADKSGGGFMNSGSEVILVDSIFSGNEANEYGGGVAIFGSRSTLINCTITGNAAVSDGGGVYCSYDWIATVENSIIWGNDGGAIGGVRDCYRRVAYCDIEGGWDGEGNRDSDPLFQRHPDPGPDDEWGTEDDDYGDLHLQSDSPCIDAADNDAVLENTETDLDGNPRFADVLETEDTGRGTCGVVDMGPYEFLPEIGACCLRGGCFYTTQDECPSCERNPEWLCDGDVDGDGIVNPVDLGLVNAAFESSDEQDLCQYDMDCDGQINPVDAGIVQSLFGTCEPPRPSCGPRWSPVSCECADCG